MHLIVSPSGSLPGDGSIADRDFSVSIDPGPVFAIIYGKIYSSITINMTRQLPVGYQHTRCAVAGDLVVFGPKSFRYVQVGERWSGASAGFGNGVVQMEFFTPDAGVNDFPAGLGPSLLAFKPQFGGGSVPLATATKAQSQVTVPVDSSFANLSCGPLTLGAVTNPRFQSEATIEQPVTPSVMAMRIAEDGTMTIAWETPWPLTDWREDGWKSAPLITGSKGDKILIARQTVGTLIFESPDHDTVRRALNTKNLAIARFSLPTGELEAEDLVSAWKNEVPWWVGTTDTAVWPNPFEDPYARGPAAMGEPIPGDIMLWTANNVLVSIQEDGKMVILK
jgi:hypothetical protein